MPEFVDSTIITSSQKLAEGYKTQEPGSFLTQDNIERLVKEEDLKLVGWGGECVVVAPKEFGAHDVVVAMDYDSMETSKSAKELFYVHRILSTLFPHNFPRFYTSYGSGPEMKWNSGTVRQRIYEQTEDAEPIYPFNDVAHAADEMGNFPVQLDPGSSKNKVIGADGGEYYMDKVRVLPELPADKRGSDDYIWDTPKIVSYMEKHGYPAVDQRIVLRSINRLRELQIKL